MVTILAQNVSSPPLGSVAMIAEVGGGRGVVPRRPFRELGAFGLTAVTRGRGAFSTPDALDVEVGAGDAILTLPGLPHSFGPSGEHTWDEVFAIFDGPVFDLLLGLGTLRADRRILSGVDTAGRLREIASRPERQVTELVQLLVDITSSAPVDWVVQARLLLEGELSVPVSGECVATKVGMAYQTFRKRFRSAVGVSPGRYRLRHRVETAKSLLGFTSLSHREIARQLGFSDEFHFSKAFKAVSGVTPSEFRK
jgi:AraC-like DNA-binding protein